MLLLLYHISWSDGQRSKKKQTLSAAELLPVAVSDVRRNYPRPTDGLSLSCDMMRRTEVGNIRCRDGIDDCEAPKTRIRLHLSAAPR